MKVYVFLCLLIFVLQAHAQGNDDGYVGSKANKWIRQGLKFAAMNGLVKMDSPTNNPRFPRDLPVPEDPVKKFEDSPIFTDTHKLATGAKAAIKSSGDSRRLLEVDEIEVVNSHLGEDVVELRTVLKTLRNVIHKDDNNKAKRDLRLLVSDPAHVEALKYYNVWYRPEFRQVLKEHDIIDIDVTEV